MSREWLDRAACRDVEGFTELPAEEAIWDHCQGCPVKAECLAWGIETGATDVVYGGVKFLPSTHAAPSARVRRGVGSPADQRRANRAAEVRAAQVRAAVFAGESKTAIARRLGVNRLTVYRDLGMIS